MAGRMANARLGNRSRGVQAADKGRGPGLAFTGREPHPYVAVEQAKYTKNWPRRDPKQAHQRVVGRHTARSKSAAWFLKTWGSRPESKREPRLVAA